ncbi:hypothetical protein O3P69_001715 [Scylla paramamosain]|uniref:Zasp-like motif domain-containing protein n=1 Tax=Scylla paramamosain TaxID=85552 RepID=A0AAW0V1N7_SCYPA
MRCSEGAGSSYVLWMMYSKLSWRLGMESKLPVLRPASSRCLEDGHPHPTQAARTKSHEGRAAYLPFDNVGTVSNRAFNPVSREVKSHSLPYTTPANTQEQAIELHRRYTLTTTSYSKLVG